MPITSDSLSANPSPVQPSSGEGSQTPLSINKESTPVGGTPAPKPAGSPGAPAGNSNAASPAAPGAGAAKQPAAPQISPEDVNRYKAIQQSLYPDLASGMEELFDGKKISALDDEEVKQLIDYLLDIGWDSTYLSSEVLKSTDSSSIKEFLQLVVDFQEKSDEIDIAQFKNYMKQKEISVKQQEKSNKQMEQALSQPAQAPGAPALGAPMPGAQSPQTQPQPPAAQTKASSFHGDKNHDENNINTRGDSMPSDRSIMVSDGVLKTASEGTPEVLTALFKSIKVAETSIEKYRNASYMLEGAKALGESTDSFDVERLAKDVQSKIAELSDKLDEAKDEQKKVDNPDMDKKFDDVISKGKDIASKGKGLFEKKEAPKAPEKKDEKPEEKKEEGKSEPKKDIAKPSFEKKDEPKKEEGKMDSAPSKEEAKSLFAALSKKVKSAQLYPFKDQNKQNQSKINETSAKDQKRVIDKEISGGAKAEGKNPLNMNAENSKVPTPKFIGKVKKEAFDNGSAKHRLAVEMAAQQQLKGLLDNPLKTAMIKNMVDAGLDVKTAEAVAFNSFVDGFQASQELILKEASSFVKKDFNEFKKIASVTIKSPVIETSEAVTASEETKQPVLRSASVKSQISYTDLIRDRLKK